MSVNQINGREISAVVSQLRQRGRMIERAAKMALRQGVNDVVSKAKRLVPVDTGNLQNSIHAIEENDGASYKIVADAENSNGKRYGRYVEFDPRINKPFLFTAIDAEKRRLNERIKSAVQGQI